MTLSEGSKEAIYLGNLIGELFGFFSCATVFIDNQSVVKRTLNPIFHKRTKHIDVRHDFVWKAVTNGSIDIKYLKTDEMPANLLTKAMGLSKHVEFTSTSGLVDVSEGYGERHNSY